MPDKQYKPGTVEPGWTTTEFYQTVLVHVVAAVVAVTTLIKTGFTPDGAQAAIPAVALAASAIAQAAYSVARSRVKTTALESMTPNPGPAAGATVSVVPPSGDTSLAQGGPANQQPNGSAAQAPTMTVVFNGFDVKKGA